MAAGRFEFLFRFGEEGLGTSMFRTQVLPDRSVPLHGHADSERLHVLPGAIEVFRQNPEPGWTMLEAAQNIVIRNGTLHALRNSGGVAADLLVATNDRLATFFQDAGRPAHGDEPFLPPSMDDIRRPQQASEGYGYATYTPAQSLEITA